MSDVQTQFARAVEDVQALQPDNDTKLKLYALYKQATQGDVTGEQPGVFDFVQRAKFDAWNAVKGTSADSAKRQYVALVKSLKQ